METLNRSFDPNAHLRKIRTRQGMQDYLDVKWRLMWLRSEHPDAQIITEQIAGDAEHARFKCTIQYTYDALIGIDGGTEEYDRRMAIGTGHGSETAGDFPDFYEKAETKAIGRACATLGYGTDTAVDLDDGEPLDGRAAAKDERADRVREDARERPQGSMRAAGAARTAANPEPPSRLPTTRRGPQSSAEPVPIRPDTDLSNVHQHTQLRALADNGYDLSAALKRIGVARMEDLSREQAKAAIIEGRATSAETRER